MKIKNLCQKYAVPIYFILTIILTWGGMALAAAPGGFPISESQFENSGALIYIAMLIGPAGAGLTLTAVVEGKTGFRNLFHSLLRWRVNIRWIAVALFTAPTLILSLLSGLSIFSPEFKPAIFTTDGKAALILSSIAAGLVVGLFEEIGWTGFATPRMRQTHGILKTGLLIGILWGLWHFPPFWKTDSFSAAFPFILLLGQLFSWLPPYRILMTWVYDKTQSLLVAVLMHASLMASLNALVPTTLVNSSLLTWIFTWAAGLWIITSIGYLLRERNSTNSKIYSQATKA